MLTKTNKKTSFDQFLFSHFDLKPKNKSVLKMDFCDIRDESSVKEKIAKKSTIKKRKPVEPVAQGEAVVDEKEIIVKENFASLVDVIDSIPEKFKSLNIEELTHKHESEWYHTFKDLQEEIVTDLSKKHPNYYGILKLKSEIREFWEQLDEHIEKAILELERLFQAFPAMSRVAVIYLLSIIIAIPLVFLSATKSAEVSIAPVSGSKIPKIQSEAIKFTSEMKADYVAKNSAAILASGKTFIQVTEGSKSGRVAGVYEGSGIDLNADNKKRKISGYYNYLSNLKDEIGYFIKNKLAK